MPGTFDMSGNMAGAGAPGGIQQQQMITPGQQQQAFARQQQQQQLLGTEFFRSFSVGRLYWKNQRTEIQWSVQSVVATIFL